MIVAKNSISAYNPISYGNTAYDYEKYEYERQNYKHKIHTKQRNKVNRQKQLKLIGMVVMMLCTGMLIVGRYALIVKLNRQYINMKNELAENQKANEALNIELMKYYDIKQIEKNATTELNMVRPENSNIVHIDIDSSEENSRVASADDAAKPEGGLIGRIVKFFN